MNFFKEDIFMTSIPSWFVIVVGLGIVFLGLICIILLCKILGAICSIGQQKETVPQALAATAPVTPVPQAVPAFKNRQEVIAAIGAAIAEESGCDANAIRIVSIKKI